MALQNWVNLVFTLLGIILTRKRLSSTWNIFSFSTFPFSSWINMMFVWSGESKWEQEVDMKAARSLINKSVQTAISYWINVKCLISNWSELSVLMSSSLMSALEIQLSLYIFSIHHQLWLEKFDLHIDWWFIWKSMFRVVLNWYWMCLQTVQIHCLSSVW